MDVLRGRFCRVPLFFEAVLCLPCGCHVCCSLELDHVCVWLLVGLIRSLCLAGRGLVAPRLLAYSVIVSMSVSSMCVRAAFLNVPRKTHGARGIAGCWRATTHYAGHSFLSARLHRNMRVCILGGPARAPCCMACIETYICTYILFGEPKPIQTANSPVLLNYRWRRGLRGGLGHHKFRGEFRGEFLP